MCCFAFFPIDMLVYAENREGTLVDKCLSILNDTSLVYADALDGISFNSNRQ